MPVSPSRKSTTRGVGLVVSVVVLAVVVVVVLCGLLGNPETTTKEKPLSVGWILGKASAHKDQEQQQAPHPFLCVRWRLNVHQ